MVGMTYWSGVERTEELEPQAQAAVGVSLQGELGHSPANGRESEDQTWQHACAGGNNDTQGATASGV